jgi:hypothetical protein
VQTFTVFAKQNAEKRVRTVRMSPLCERLALTCGGVGRWGGSWEVADGELCGLAGITTG